MNKPDLLRALLLRVVPAIAADPTKLVMFVDNGSVNARAGATLSFEYAYTLDITIEDYAGDRDMVIVPILAWIGQYQPDLLQRSSGVPLTFDAELLDADTSDLSIKIELTERVIVEQLPDGKRSIRHVETEPADLDRFEGLCGAKLWQLFMRDELVAQTSDPAFHP